MTARRWAREAEVLRQERDALQQQVAELRGRVELLTHPLLTDKERALRATVVDMAALLREAEAALDAAREEADKFCEALEAYSREVVRAAETAYGAVCLHASDVPSVILRLGVEKDAAREETARVRGVLAELAALVRGECPSLLNEDSGGDARLDAEIDAALTGGPPQPAARTEEG